MRQRCQSEKEREGGSGFTGNFAEVRWHLRICELELEQPGVRGVLRGGGYGRGGAGLFIGADKLRIGQGITGLNGAAVITTVRSPRVIFGEEGRRQCWRQRWDPPVSQREGKGAYRFGREERWAMGWFRLWAELCPGALLCFFLVKTFFPFLFYLKPFAKTLQFGLNQF
jgi:hypothetical protein